MEKQHYTLAGSGEKIRYSVRKSRRAKYVRLQVSPREGLVVVVPERFDLRRVPGILRDRAAWIEKALQKLPVSHPCEAALPERLFLRSIGEEWTVLYGRSEEPQSFLAERPGRVIDIRSSSNDSGIPRDLLREWAKRKAKCELLPRLDDVARRHGFNYIRGMIRHQRTKWGSCSTKSTISLNMKLLFLPGELVEYIMLHELVHTEHMNHSQQFWSLVERHMPDYRSREVAMKKAGEYVPAFAAL